MNLEKLLVGILASVVELLPRHTAECGVHDAHPSYGDEYCDCNMAKVKRRLRRLLDENQSVTDRKAETEE